MPLRAKTQQRARNASRPVWSCTGQSQRPRLAVDELAGHDTLPGGDASEGQGAA